MPQRSLVTMILVEGGLALSAIATLLGAGGLLAGIVVLAMSMATAGTRGSGSETGSIGFGRH